MSSRVSLQVPADVDEFRAEVTRFVAARWPTRIDAASSADASDRVARNRGGCFSGQSH